MFDVSSRARQFTIIQTVFGPMLYVRSSTPADARGCSEWGKWRKARPSEVQMAQVKLIELQVN
jgi:hypothetical protein